MGKLCFCFFWWVSVSRVRFSFSVTVEKDGNKKITQHCWGCCFVSEVVFLAQWRADSSFINNDSDVFVVPKEEF